MCKCGIYIDGMKSVVTQEDLAAVNTKLDALTASLKNVTDDNSNQATKRTTWFYDFELTMVGGDIITLGEGKYIHFNIIANDNSGFAAGSPVEIPPWRCVGPVKSTTELVTFSGVFNPDSNDIAKFEGSEGTSNHVLFINYGLVKTTMANFMLTKSQKFTVEASVGGGNRNNDGGYKIMFYSAETGKELASMVAGRKIGGWREGGAQRESTLFLLLKSPPPL